MRTAKELINSAAAHIGEQYVFGIVVPMNNPNWKGPWDCAEFVSYITYQLTKDLYGSKNNDCYTGYWSADAANGKVNVVSIAEAAGTEGAILLRKPRSNKIGHIAFCDGKGGTIEARGKAYGVCRHTALGAGGSNVREWDMGIKIPSISYEPARELSRLQFSTAQVITGESVIKRVQLSLQQKGIYSGNVSGIPDEAFSLSLYNFQ